MVELILVYYAVLVSVLLLEKLVETGKVANVLSELEFKHLLQENLIGNLEVGYLVTHCNDLLPQLAIVRLVVHMFDNTLPHC